MDEPIVINTGPLIALARAEALDVVGRLPLQFLCPVEVRQELNRGLPLGHPAIDPSWLQTVALERPPHPVALAALDLGEAAVIDLALSQGIEWVCLDDQKGRRAALASSLRVTGTLGLLARAKSAGLIGAVRPFIVRLEREGAWYDRGLVERVLRGLGEL
jgi:predicted nucleic acid-binding protein